MARPSQALRELDAAHKQLLRDSMRLAEENARLKASLAAMTELVRDDIEERARRLRVAELAIAGKTVVDV